MIVVGPKSDSRSTGKTPSSEKTMTLMEISQFLLLVTNGLEGSK